mgnify:FL=1
MPPGLQHYTKLGIGKEATAGTAVAASRHLYPDGTGFFSIDPMLTFAEDANRGTKTHVAAATQQGIAVGVSFRSPAQTGTSYDELVIPFSQIRGGVTGSGATAAKVWTFTPDQDAASSQEAYTLEPGDDNMSWRMEYGQVSRWRLSAAIDSPTMLEMDFYARQAAITSTMSNPTPLNPVRIASKRWAVRFATTQAGLNAQADVANFLLDFDVDVQTGLTPRKYMDGVDYFGQGVEGEQLDFTLTMHGESTSVASTRYGKWIAREVDFIRLRNNGPSIGSTTYAAQLDLAVLWTNVQPIASADAGVNVWEFTGRAAYDATWDNSLVGHLINSVTLLPAL